MRESGKLPILQSKIQMYKIVANSGDVGRWWWHILDDFLVKVSKFRRRNGYFDMESSKLGRMCHH